MRTHIRSRKSIAILASVLLATMLLVARDRSPKAYASGGLAPACGKTGELQILNTKGQVLGVCPLKHTAVTAEIVGFSARVNVTQEFANPSKDKIEAIYVFPLPHDSAVDRMDMKIGQRTIRGLIKRKAEAKQIYEQAKNQGHVAALLDQERPNIFTQSVANIMPGEKILINISYIQMLDYEDGIYQFVFPMVVGPRYMPGKPTGQTGTGWAPDTSQVPDASKISPPVTPPGTRAGHDISIDVKVYAGVPIEDVTSVQHEIDTKKLSDTNCQVSLRDQATIPNKDFTLKYRVGGARIQSGLIAYTKRSGDGYFTLILQPPPKPANSIITPKEMIFVIDSSGSMMGEPIEKAKATMELCIKQMNPDDTFQLIGFSNDIDKAFDAPQRNTPETQAMGLTFLRERTGGGGTEMMKAIDAALTPPADPDRLRIVCFMTDGYVGNDMEILAAVKEKIGNARFFSFGVGSSPNRFLLDGLAKIGRGAGEYVALGSPTQEAADRFCDRIANPLLMDIEIDWGGLSVNSVYPDQIPDLFSSKPIIVKGRYSKAGSGKITIRGKQLNEPWSQTVDVSLPENEPNHTALAPLWARAYIDKLMEEDYKGIQQGSPKAETETEITRVALQYSIMSQYTSFVAVEDKVVTTGGKPKTVAVPVEMPQGVSYEGIFGGEDKVWADPKSAGAALYGATPLASMAAPATPPAGAPVARQTALAYSGPAGPMALGTLSDEFGIGSSGLGPDLKKIVDAWAKDGKLPADLNIKVQDGRIQVIVWMKDITDAKLTKLRELGFEIKIYAKSSGMIFAWAPITKLETAAKLEYVTAVQLPEMGKKQK